MAVGCEVRLFVDKEDSVTQGVGGDAVILVRQPGYESLCEGPWNACFHVGAIRVDAG